MGLLGKKRLLNYARPGHYIVGDLRLIHEYKNFKPRGLKDFGTNSFLTPYDYLKFSGSFFRLDYYNVYQWWKTFRDPNNWEFPKYLDPGTPLDIGHAGSMENQYDFYAAEDWSNKNVVSNDLIIYIVPKSGTGVPYLTIKEFLNGCDQSDSPNSSDSHLSAHIYNVRNMMYFARKIGYDYSIKVHLKLMGRSGFESIIKSEVGENLQKTVPVIQDFDFQMRSRPNDPNFGKASISFEKTKKSVVFDRLIQESFPEHAANGLTYGFGGVLVLCERRRQDLARFKQTRAGKTIREPINLNELASEASTSSEEFPDGFENTLSNRNKFYTVGLRSDEKSPIVKSKRGNPGITYKTNTCNDVYAYNYKPESISEKDCVYLGCESSSDCPQDTHLCVHNYCTNVVKKSDLISLPDKDIYKILSRIDSKHLTKRSIQKLKSMEKNNTSRNELLYKAKIIINSAKYKGLIPVYGKNYNKIATEKFDYYDHIMSHGYKFTPIDEIKRKTVNSRGKDINTIEWKERHPSLVSNKSSLKIMARDKIKNKSTRRKK